MNPLGLVRWQALEVNTGTEYLGKGLMEGGWSDGRAWCEEALEGGGVLGKI